jgi:hypothetical protein
MTNLNLKLTFINQYVSLQFRIGMLFAKNNNMQLWKLIKEERMENLKGAESMRTKDIAVNYRQRRNGVL